MSALPDDVAFDNDVTPCGVVGLVQFGTAQKPPSSEGTICVTVSKQQVKILPVRFAGRINCFMKTQGRASVVLLHSAHYF